MGKGKLFVGLTAILIAGYMVGSPFITVYQMKSAAEKNDICRHLSQIPNQGVLISERIFPCVTSN